MNNGQISEQYLIARATRYLYLNTFGPQLMPWESSAPTDCSIAALEAFTAAHKKA
jgi:hypothetical protein